MYYIYLSHLVSLLPELLILSPPYVTTATSPSLEFLD